MKQSIETRLSQMAASGELQDKSVAALAVFFLALVVAEGLKNIASAIDDK